jgi:hypothetical protein
MKHHKLLPKGRKIRDTDFITTFAEFTAWTRKHKAKIVKCVPLSGDKFHVRFRSGWNFEFEIAWPGSVAEQLIIHHASRDGGKYASPEILLALKLSHRYLKNSPFFLKTMKDIQRLRRKGVQLDPWLEGIWLPRREKETYVYSHPKLDVTSKDFFTGDGVNYIYDHDSIHEAVALHEEHRENGEILPFPAYKVYMQDGSEVMTSKKKFMATSETFRLYGVYEETCVLALERSQIPHGLGKDGGPTPRWSFETALMKVCTSITSGWFRSYAWDHYDKVLDLYNQLGENHYIGRFHRNSHLLKPYAK